jgi:hypothetical protein
MAESPLIAIGDDDASIRDARTSLLRAAGWQVKDFAADGALLESGQVHTTECLLLSMRGCQGAVAWSASGRWGETVRTSLVCACWYAGMRPGEPSRCTRATLTFGRSCVDTVLLVAFRVARAPACGGTWGCTAKQACSQPLRGVLDGCRQ